MRCRRLRSNRSSRYAGVRNAVSFEEAVSGVKKINARVKRERLAASAAEREKYLRSLLGLGPVRSLSDDETRT